MKRDALVKFLIESNKIEGIDVPISGEVTDYCEVFLRLPSLNVDAVMRVVKLFQPDAVLRDQKGLDVRVGIHTPRAGGQEIVRELVEILECICRKDHPMTPYGAHVEYENLHPFTDGNGRSGRLVWLWQMENQYGGAPLGFLHQFYYQSLQFSHQGD